MKTKIIVLLALSIFAAATVQAATIDSGTSTTIGGGTFSPSTKVHIAIVSDGSSYGATSQHESGTVAYGSGGGTPFTLDSSKIYTQTCATNPCGATAITPTATAIGTGTWN